MHVRSFSNGEYNYPLHFPLLSPPSPNPTKCFQPELPMFFIWLFFVVVVVLSFQWCTAPPPHPPPSESMRDTEHVWGLLCHVTSIYFLKEKKRKSSHSLNYEDNSNLKFCCWFYIFSFQQCTVIKKTHKKIHTFVVVGLEFQWLCSTCCIETFQTNETHTHTHTKFSSWCCNFFLLRLFYPVDPSCSTRVTVAVIEKPPWNHSLP